jgi:hypothetical protein
LPAAIGKSCGACTMCCSALEITELKKPAGPRCNHCAEAGCRIYPERPQVCRDFECQWLTDRRLPPHFRPDRIGVLFMEDYELGEYRAVCAPSRAMAWRQPRVFAHLVAMAKSGRVVVAKAGLSAWRVYASGEFAPTV